MLLKFMLLAALIIFQIWQGREGSAGKLACEEAQGE